MRERSLRKVGNSRMHTRPGAIDFLRCALKKSPRSCTLGIFADSDAWLVQLCETNVTETNVTEIKTRSTCEEPQQSVWSRANEISSLGETGHREKADPEKAHPEKNAIQTGKLCKSIRP